jgi:hypothetical protein
VRVWDEGFPQGGAESPSARFNPAQEPYYGHPLPVLQSLVLSSGKNRTVKHFCVIGYQWPNDTETVWVRYA